MENASINLIIPATTPWKLAQPPAKISEFQKFGVSGPRFLLPKELWKYSSKFTSVFGFCCFLVLLPACHRLLRKNPPWNKITPVKFQVPWFSSPGEIQCGFCHGRITSAVTGQEGDRGWCSRVDLLLILSEGVLHPLLPLTDCSESVLHLLGWHCSAHGMASDRDSLFPWIYLSWSAVSDSISVLDFKKMLLKLYPWKDELEPTKKYYKQMRFLPLGSVQQVFLELFYHLFLLLNVFMSF